MDASFEASIGWVECRGGLMETQNWGCVGYGSLNGGYRRAFMPYLSGCYGDGLVLPRVEGYGNTPNTISQS